MQFDGHIPVPTGEQSLGPAALDAERRTLQITSAARLADLTDEYVFFSHGPFYLWSGLEFDPVADLIAREGMPPPALLTCQLQLFAGLAPNASLAEWEHRLLALPRLDAEPWLRALAGLATVDRDRRRLHRAVRQDIRLPDPLFLAKQAVWCPQPPLIDVTVFGVSGTHVHKLVFAGDALPAKVVDLPCDPLAQDTAQQFFRIDNHMTLVDHEPKLARRPTGPAALGRRRGRRLRRFDH